MRLPVLFIALLCACAAWAQLRTIPAEAQRAYMRHVETNIVELNGQRTELAPGAQIRDAANRLIVPMSLPADSLVKYRLDASGKVHEVWILTREEAEAK